MTGPPLPVPRDGGAGGTGTQRSDGAHRSGGLRASQSGGAATALHAGHRTGGRGRNPARWDLFLYARVGPAAPGGSAAGDLRDEGGDVVGVLAGDELGGHLALAPGSALGDRVLDQRG